MKKVITKGTEIPYLTSLSIPIEAKAASAAEGADDGDLLIEGYASTISKDRVGDIVMPSAFKEAIKSYLESPVLLYMHDKAKPIGAVTDVKIDSEGVKVKGYISTASKFARDEVIPLVKKKILNSFSVGFIPKEGRYEPKDDAFIITKGELLEISVVSVAANRDAKFSVAKEFVENPEFESLREIWKKSAENEISKQNKSIEENNKMDERLKELEAQLKKAMEDSTALKAKLESKESELASTAEKAKKFEELQKLEEQKAAEKAATDRKTEMEALQKQLDTSAELIKKLSEQFETVQKDLEEAKAMAKKGGTRIEFGELPTAAIWKDYGEMLDNAWLAGRVLRVDQKQLMESNSFKPLPEQVKAMAIDAAFQTLAGRRIWEDIRANATLVSLFDTLELPTDTYKLPFDASSITSEWVDAGATQQATNTLTINPVTFSPTKLMTKIKFNYEDEADSLIPVVAQARKNLVNSMADTLDQTIISGDGTGEFRGLEHYAANASGTAGLEATIPVGENDGLLSSGVYAGMIKMKKYAFKRNDMVVLLNFHKYGQIVADPTVVTVDKFGPMATIHNGELAKVWGKPIIVSDFVSGTDTATTGKAGLLVYTPGFLVGWRNNMMVEVDKDIEYQTKIIVMTFRVDFRPVYPHVAQIDSDKYPIVMQLLNGAAS